MRSLLFVPGDSEKKLAKSLGAVLRVDGGFWWKDCRPEGLMAKAVLANWGVRSTGDIGNIVRPARRGR